ncbi:MAG: NUDIX domain-containing protein [Flavobacteriales bacterium]|nr:NUDIX domain-containing protein [Flavobacteriales bacterium]
MAQKYKVFIEEKVIYFTNEELLNLPKYEGLEPQNFQELKESLVAPVYQFVSPNPKSAMKYFFSNFRKIKAAGGIVKSGNEQLFIKRNGKWDIPKGKMEKGEKPRETAIREIQEECGLKGNLTIESKLLKTYHCYFMFDQSVLKKTTWFVLNYEGSKNVEAQAEEGITEVVWLKKNQLSKVKNNTFSSVRDVLEYYKTVSKVDNLGFLKI